MHFSPLAGLTSGWSQGRLKPVPVAVSSIAILETHLELKYAQLVRVETI